MSQWALGFQTLSFQRQVVHDVRWRFGKILLFLFLVTAIVCLGSRCLADSPAEPAGADSSAGSLPSCATADNVWVLVSSALVLMMTAPGPGTLLLRPGPQEERAERDDAVHLPDVPDDGDLGLIWL